MSTVGIINSPYSNIGSVYSLFSDLSHSVSLLNPSDDFDHDLIVFPGNGTFSKTMNWIRENSLDSKILHRVQSNKKFLGICVGMQIMSHTGYEGGKTPGLNYLDTETKLLDKPHIGWSSVSLPRSLDCNMSTADFFFMHCYGVYDDSGIHTDYISIYHENYNLFCQFHPEKSGFSGINLIKYFDKS